MKLIPKYGQELKMCTNIFLIEDLTFCKNIIAESKSNAVLQDLHTMKKFSDNHIFWYIPWDNVE